MKEMNFGDPLGIIKMLGPQEDMIKKSSKGEEEKLTKIDDRLEIGVNKGKELLEGKKKINGLRLANYKITNKLPNIFDHTVPIASTNDEGVVDDYIKITHNKSKFVIKETQLSVIQTAKTACTIISLADMFGANSGGFPNSTGPEIEGDLDITTNGNTQVILVVSTDSLSDIINKINATFAANGDEFHATSIVNEVAGTSYLEIISKKTGANNTITATLNNQTSANSIFVEPTRLGEDAIIRVDGVEMKSPVNSFSNVTNGLSFELKGKVNNASGSQFIRVEKDKELVEGSIIELLKNFNEISIFIGKNSERVQSNPLDPRKSSLKYADTAVLGGAHILSDMKGIINRLTNFNPTAQGSSNINTIFDLGITQIPSPDNPDIKLFEITDPATFSNRIANEFDNVQKLFNDDAKITSGVGNQGSSLIFVGAKQFPGSLQNKDIPIAVTLDVAGAITNITANVNGVLTNGTYEALGTDAFPGYISFPAASPLVGLKLYYDSKNVSNGVENFTFNFTHGLANNIDFAIEEVLSVDGTRGVLKSAIDDNLRAQATDVKEKEKIEAKIQEIIKNVEMQYAQIGMMQMQMALQIQQITEQLDSLTEK